MKLKRGCGKKSYGQYQSLTCPFCDRMATHKNKKGVAVCFRHQEISLEEFKCTCGEWLEAKESQFGPYFKCINCGNISYKKALSIREITEKKEEEKKVDLAVKSLKQETYFAPPTSVSLSNEKASGEKKEEIGRANKEAEVKKAEQKEKKETIITTEDWEYFH